MRWISEYQLFLFDLDGLLVNTEELHHQAYKNMLAARGYTLDWDFMTYFRIAQQDAEAPKRHIYATFPQLEKEEPRWEVLYQEKKHAYLKILKSQPAPLLTGAKELLEALQKANVTRCVVTHSSKNLVEVLKEKNQALATIPHWFTREDYDAPKPAPDGYLKACSQLARPSDRIIGFEDSSRGLEALLGTPATPILVNSIDEHLRLKYASQGIRTFKTLQEVLSAEQL